MRRRNNWFKGLYSYADICIDHVLNIRFKHEDREEQGLGRHNASFGAWGNSWGVESSRKVVIAATISAIDEHIGRHLATKAVLGEPLYTVAFTTS